GAPPWFYAPLAAHRPSAPPVYPMAGNPGQVLDVEPVGSARAVEPHVRLQAPSEPGVGEVSLDVGGAHTNPVPFIVSTLPQVLEAEPNDTPEQATRVTIPCGINGRVGRPRDLDHFVFAGVNGKPVRFQ